MKAEKRRQRKEEILECAFAMLREGGYQALSMQALARASNASKETLYGWFDGKAGLFEAMVAHNAALIAVPSGDEPIDIALERLGSALLGMLLGERAVLLNRVAAAEAGTVTDMGKVLADRGRNTVLPKITSYLAAYFERATIRNRDASEAAETWLSLLVGDLQVRRVTGVLAEPASAEVAERSRRAAALFLRLYAPINGDA